MCTNVPRSTKWRMTLPASYSPDSILTLRFSGSEAYTGLLVVVDKGTFPYNLLPKNLRPGLCSPMASVTHGDGDAKAANFTLSWMAPPPGAGAIRFVAMVFGSRSGRNCDYYGADVVLTEGPATPRPTPLPTPPPAPTPPTTTTPRPASTAPIPTPPTRPVVAGSVVVFARHSLLRLVTYDPGDQWDRISFEDMHWRPAIAPIGFGYPVADFGVTSFGATLRAPLQDVFVRAHFDIAAEQIAAVKSAVMRLAVDDAADIIFNQVVLDASASQSKVMQARYWSQEINVPVSALKAGDNLLAAHIANYETTNSLLFDVEVVLRFDDSTTTAVVVGPTTSPTTSRDSPVGSSGVVPGDDTTPNAVITSPVSPAATTTVSGATTTATDISPATTFATIDALLAVAMLMIAIMLLH